MSTPARSRKVLMTLDAAGGVWRYAMDLAAGLKPLGVETVFVCFGGPPTDAQALEAAALGRLHVPGAPLDWMVESEAELSAVPDIIADIARKEQVDLVHLNLPSQAAGLDVPVPVVAVAHSCVCTWFHAVRGTPVPPDWAWHRDINRRGFDRADAVLMPSQSHAALSETVYGPIARLQVVLNATRTDPAPGARAPFVFAAGRWWDDGKNGAVLNAAAPDLDWPLWMAGPNRGPSGQYVELGQTDHLGERSHAETMALMTNAAIVVSPSLYEPFGLAALEAARAGAALVLADIPTYRELWDGVALFADPRDPASFAAAINRFAREPALRTQLGEQARQRSAHFTPERQAASMGALYSRLLRPAASLSAAE